MPGTAALAAIARPPSAAAHWDEDFDRQALGFLASPPRTEPTMEYFGPYVGRLCWDLYRAIDWTHMHQRTNPLSREGRREVGGHRAVGGGGEGLNVRP